MRYYHFMTWVDGTKSPVSITTESMLISKVPILNMLQKWSLFSTLHKSGLFFNRRRKSASLSTKAGGLFYQDLVLWVASERWWLVSDRLANLQNAIWTSVGRKLMTNSTDLQWYDPPRLIISGVSKPKKRRYLSVVIFDKSHKETKWCSVFAGRHSAACLLIRSALSLLSLRYFSLQLACFLQTAAEMFPCRRFDIFVAFLCWQLMKRAKLLIEIFSPSKKLLYAATFSWLESTSWEA